MQPDRLPEIRGDVEPGGAIGKRPLIVVLHGNRGGRDTVGAATEVAREAMEARENRPAPDLWVPVMPHSRYVSFAGLGNTARALKEKLDGYWSDDYDELVIIGHSTGGALARALFIEGAQSGSPWAERLLASGRIVMLGGMNRGWRISHHLSLKHAVLWTAGAMAGHFLALFGLRLGLFDLRRGSLFLTKMRFDWLELAKQKRTPLTVQLLGTIDDLVGPEDAIDLVTGASFRYLDVPHSGHLSVLEMGGTGRESRERADVLRIALDAESVIIGKEVLPWGLQSHDPAKSPGRSKPKESAVVDHVVFVIHGIRDKGYWTDKIARHIWKKCKPAKREGLERVTSSYGYFGMGPFLFPWVRRRKVEWLADQVLEARARFPDARLSYVGHSNGTYLLASALETYRDIGSFRFDRIVFAGSVVPRDYDWKPVTTGDPSTSVLNITATGDWVVAFFPQLFELVPIQDLGSAGHNGFDPGSPQVTNFQYAAGGHGAGIDEAFWDHIAGFVLGDDKSPEVDGVGVKPSSHPGVAELDRRGQAMRWLKSFTPLPVWLFLACLLFVLVPAVIVRVPGLIALAWGWLVTEWAGLSSTVLAAQRLASPLSIGGAALVVLALSGAIAGGVRAFFRTAKAEKSGGRRSPLGAALVSTMVIIALAASVLFPARLVGLALADPTSWQTGLLALYFVALVSVLKRL